MPNHMPPPKTRCAHKNYWLTCDDYDRLVTSAAGACQICRATPEQTPKGFLVVDHDAKLGQWAVRGLLCNRCNGLLPCGSEATARTAAYLADPWWRRECVRRGLSPEVQPEPPVGAVVMTPTVRLEHAAAGWVHTAAYRRGMPRDWAYVNRKYGPHNIRIPERYRQRAAPPTA